MEIARDNSLFEFKIGRPFTTARVSFAYTVIGRLSAVLKLTFQVPIRVSYLMYADGGTVFCNRLRSQHFNFFLFIVRSMTAPGTHLDKKFI